MAARWEWSLRMTAFVRRVLYAWAGRLPAVIYDAEVSEINPARTPLFERYHVFTCRLPWLGEVTLYLHHYLRSDPDRGPHDHPWPWAVALPLAGGYHEDRFIGLRQHWLALKRRRRQPLVPYRMTGFDFHKVVINDQATSWSLFLTGANGHKAWGFLRPLEDDSGVYYQPQYSKSAKAEWWETAPRGCVIQRAAP
jgi:hypothetical protein